METRVQCAWTYSAPEPPISVLGRRRTSDVSLSLQGSSLLQTAANPHGHHLRVAVVELRDEGMVLRNEEHRGGESN